MSAIGSVCPSTFGGLPAYVTTCRTPATFANATAPLWPLPATSQTRSLSMRDAGTFTARPRAARTCVRACRRSSARRSRAIERAVPTSSGVLTPRDGAIVIAGRPRFVSGAAAAAFAREELPAATSTPE